MKAIKELHNEISDVMEELDNSRKFIRELHYIMGMDTESQDCSLLKNKIVAMRSGNNDGLSAETNHIIDLTLNAVQLQLDNIYMYNDEPYIDVNDYTDEINILLVGKDDTFSLDETEVRDCVYDDLTPKEEEPKEEDSSEETTKENENE
tara:strand:- start:1123 stop:1569 length:447 start_codon:yes stop_codon:yes gene_type:complete